jgi:malonyl-CoA O-methyltransferase
LKIVESDLSLGDFLIIRKIKKRTILIKRLAVIPSDPIEEYLKRGYSPVELEGYYNPCKYFDEVYLLSDLEKKTADILGMKVIPTPAKALRRRLKELNINVVRAYGGNWACARACERRVPGVPVVVSVHDARSERIYEPIKKADIVLCVSAAVKEAVSEKFKRPDRIWLLPNRVDFKAMRPYWPEETHDLEKMFPFRYRILFVGRLSEEKNLDTLVKALKILGDEFGLVAVGQGDKEFYRTLAEKEKVARQVVFIDSIFHDDLARYYSLADCTCIPSRSEGFGMVFIEALACGAVVVTSNIPPLNEYIQNRKNGLLVDHHDDPRALAAAIQEACCDPALRRTVKDNARRSVANFERTKVDELEAEYYRKVLAMNEMGEFSASAARRLRLKPKAATAGREKKRHTRGSIIQNYVQALDWVKTNTMDEGGIMVSSVQRYPYLEVTGYLIPTLLECGEYNLAYQYAEFLSYMQRPSGAFAGTDGREYIFDSAQALRGLAAAAGQWEEFQPSAQKTADYLAASIEAGGAMPSIYDGDIPEAVHLYALAGLITAAGVLRRPEYARRARQAVEYYKGRPDVLDEQLLTHFLMYIIDGFIEMGEVEFVRPWVERIISRQKKDGGLPGRPKANWVCSVGVAQFAVICYKLKYYPAGDKAVAYLCAKQNASGGFYGSYGVGAKYFPKEEISWANKFFIDAVHLKIQSFFDGHVGMFPVDIPADDARLEAVVTAAGGMDGGKILDVGCAKGRFAVQMKGRFPSCEVHGVDISDELLSCVPDGIIKKKGNVLHLPYEDEMFDLVYCVEILEHTMRTDKAVGELCRVLKENGTLVIIDKNIELGRMERADFEQWFNKEDIRDLLARQCRDVQLTELQFVDKKLDHLFWAATAKKGAVILDKSQWHKAIILDLTVPYLAKKIRRNQLPVWCKPIFKHTRANDSLLELGSGTGELSAVFALYGRRCHLLDYTQGSIDFAEDLFKELGLKAQFYCADFLKGLPLEDKSVDWVFSSGVLEHFKPAVMVDVLRESRRVARRGVISLVPNAQCIFYRVGKEAMERAGTWAFGKEVPQLSMRQQFEAAGLKNILEYSTGTYHALEFWGSRHPEIKDFFRRLGTEELQKINQGYLLFTLGESPV